MNYRHVYMLLVFRAKSEQLNGLRPLSPQDKHLFKDQYFEFHHILPKSLFPKWSKNKRNIIPLTGREHLFCHMLLTKIYPKSAEMWSALWFMASKSKKEKSNYPKLTLREYERIHIKYTKSNSEHLKGKKNPNMARILSEEIRKAISEKHKGNTYVKGKSWWTKDGKCTMAFECPGDGWERGRNTKGRIAWNRGIPQTLEAKMKLKETKRKQMESMTEEERKKKYGRPGRIPWNKKVSAQEVDEKC